MATKKPQPKKDPVKEKVTVALKKANPKTAAEAVAAIKKIPGLKVTEVASEKKVKEPVATAEPVVAKAAPKKTTKVKPSKAPSTAGVPVAHTEAAKTTTRVKSRLFDPVLKKDVVKTTKDKIAGRTVLKQPGWVSKTTSSSLLAAVSGTPEQPDAPEVEVQAPAPVQSAPSIAKADLDVSVLGKRGAAVKPVTTASFKSIVSGSTTPAPAPAPVTTSKNAGGKVSFADLQQQMNNQVQAAVQQTNPLAEFMRR